MQLPKRGPIEWNLNTVIVLLGFTFTWGVTYQMLQSVGEANMKDIRQLVDRMRALETTSRILDNHELRLSNVETTSRDASASMRAIESGLNNLSSDLRLMRASIERLEQTRSEGRQL